MHSVVLQAVQQMHQQGRGHNDLKPQNIIVHFRANLTLAGVTLIDLGSSCGFQGEHYSIHIIVPFCYSGHQTQVLLHCATSQPKGAATADPLWSCMLFCS